MLWGRKLNTVSVNEARTGTAKYSDSFEGKTVAVLFYGAKAQAVFSSLFFFWKIGSMSRIGFID
jgi:hypothetical protein